MVRGLRFVIVPTGAPSSSFGRFGLLICCFVGGLGVFLQFEIFFARVAFFAGFAVFMGGDTAFMGASFAFGCRLLTTGFISRRSRARLQGNYVNNRNHQLDNLHIRTSANFLRLPPLVDCHTDRPKELDSNRMLLNRALNVEKDRFAKKGRGRG
jgi:hypothetical protein